MLCTTRDHWCFGENVIRLTVIVHWREDLIIVPCCSCSPTQQCLLGAILHERVIRHSLTTHFLVLERKRRIERMRGETFSIITTIMSPVWRRHVHLYTKEKNVLRNFDKTYDNCYLSQTTESTGRYKTVAHYSKVTMNKNIFKMTAKLRRTNKTGGKFPEGSFLNVSWAFDSQNMRERSNPIQPLCMIMPVDF